ncbi:MAG: T9SS type A sorting domain-containing protein [Crocinitomicaceae bacterium]
MRNSCLLALVFFTIQSLAQQGDGFQKNYKSTIYLKELNKVSFPEPDVSSLKAEDALVDGTGTAPWRFGWNNYTNLNTANAGTWTSLPNGDRIWHLLVECEQALTINLTFENTSIPEGNELYVFNPEKEIILGSFNANHLYQGQLGTELIPGSRSIIEYYVPKNNPEGHVQVAVVTHGYRSAQEFQNKAFGSSGSCNRNVNCSEGGPWVQQRNAAVMLVSGSNGFCSGSLINNTLNNGKPYVLTANHCYSNPANWIFRFQWQSPDCNNPAASPSFLSLSGAVLRARATASDFCLVEITGGLSSGTIPLSYTPYFAGWDNSGTTPQSAVCIHHPSGDIKKISFENDPLISTTFGTCPPNSHWGITNWDSGVTEGGSSGSPIYDANRHIIGQLHGGASACGAASLSDEYGKFSYSWEPALSDSTNQLKYWLDPTNIGVQFNNGFDPANPNGAQLDAGLSNPLFELDALCGTVYTPKVTITNSGTNTLTTATITYAIDGGANQIYTWNGSLTQWQTEVISLPSLTLSPGNHTLSTSVSNPNMGTDENTLNDVVNTLLTIDPLDQTMGILKVTLLTDNYPDETYMELTASNGTVVWFEGNESFVGNYGTGNSPAPTDPTAPLAANTSYNYDIPISLLDCYTFTIYDYYGDGLGASQWGGSNVDGELTLMDHTSTVIYTLPQADFVNSASNIVKNTDDSGLSDLAFVLWSLYPNPTKEVLNLSINNGQAMEVSIMDLYGKTILKELISENLIQVNTQNLSIGTYFVHVTFANGQRSVKSFVKQ